MRKWCAVTVLMVLSGAAFGQKITPKDVVANMESAWSKIDSYTCREEAWTKAGGVEKSQAFDYSFLKPAYIRLKVLAEPHKGADVVYRSGDIRAAERILGIRVKKGMSRKDDNFYSARKIPFWEVDMGSEITVLKGLLAKTDGTALKARSGADVVVYLNFKWKGEDAKLKSGSQSYTSSWKIDAKTWFPLERTTTENGAKVEEIKRTNVNLKANLSERNFNL